jgi:hypothetical protein
MTQNLTLLLHVAISDADEEQTDKLIRTLLRELRESNEIVQAGIQESPIPDGAKGVWSDWLKITFTKENLEKVFVAIRDYLPGQPIIEMELEDSQSGKKLKLKASKQKDFLMAMKQAQEFINS